MTDLPTVVYVVREHPETAIDQLLVLDGGRVEPGAVSVLRELGTADGTRYLHARLEGATDDDWEWETLQIGLEPGPFEVPGRIAVDDLVRRRAVAYATRDRKGRTELLTIEALEYPEEGIPSTTRDSKSASCESWQKRRRERRPNYPRASRLRVQLPDVLRST